MSQLARAFVASALLALVPCRSNAQLPLPSLGVVGGVSQYHLNGSGSTPFGALRIDIPLMSLVADGSVGLFRPNENGVHRTYIIPEAQLQFQLLPILIRPYIGIGGGWFTALSGPDPHKSVMTGSASAGVRAGIPLTPLRFRAEVRTRGIGSGFHSGATEWTLGIGW
ncbi:MAG: hypothetical protein ABJF01_14815 [bacterium]